MELKRAVEGEKGFEKVFAFLRQRDQTFRDVAADLHLDPSDLEGLVFGLTLVSLDGGGQGSGRGKAPLRRV